MMDYEQSITSINHKRTSGLLPL